jgi:short-subunit dehydrogenase
MADEKRPVAVITGASSGIGEALARVFAANGHALALVARRHDRLAALADEIAATGAPRPLVLPLDLARPDAAARIAEFLDQHGAEPEYVVNNAGFGLAGLAASLSRPEQLAMVDLNVRALTELSLAWIDVLARRRGGILNVASLAGFMPGPRMAVYYASKAYVLSFSEALHRELRGRRVRVTVLCPGPVHTEFVERAGIPRARTWQVLDVPVGRVAEAGYRGLMTGRRVVVPGTASKLAALLARLVPRRLVIAAVNELLRKRTARPAPPS